MKIWLLLLVSVLITTSAISQEKADSKTIRELINSKKFSEAKSILENRLETEEYPELYYWLGIIALQQNEYNEAIDYLDEAIELDENNPRYYYMLGNAYGIKARDGGMLVATFAAPKAKSNWVKALELDPDYLQALFQYYMQAPGIIGGDDARAKELAEKMMQKYPVLGQLYLANYYLNSEEDIQKAEAELRSALQADTGRIKSDRVGPAKLWMLNSMGYYMMRQKKMNDSRRYFQKAVQLASDQANPNDSMGDFYMKSAQYDSALIYFEKAVACDSTFGPSLLKRAKMLEKLGRVEEAKSAYKKVLLSHEDDRFGEEVADQLEELQ